MNYTKYYFHLICVIICSLQIVSCGFRRTEEIKYEWKITFEDNFDSFETTKWMTHHLYGERTFVANEELEWYKDENVSVNNGILKLTAKKESIFVKDSGSEKEFGYTSGMICNGMSFTQAYGKWEMKVRFPFKKGFWPAFWLIPKQRPGLPEIDVFEYFGIKKNVISCSHHWGLNYPNYMVGLCEGKTDPFYYVRSKETEGNFSNVWMTWSFECFPDKMVWKLDGNIVYESSEGIPTAPLYMIANVAIKDRAENNYQVDDTGLPYIMEIDYVRIYEMIPKCN